MGAENIAPDPLTTQPVYGSLDTNYAVTEHIVTK
jgi:hypothetical protein